VDEVMKIYTSQISSLPHLDISKALDLSFSLTLPVIPELANIDSSDGMIVKSFKGFKNVDILNLKPIIHSTELNPIQSGDISPFFDEFKDMFENSHHVHFKFHHMGPFSACYFAQVNSKTELINQFMQNILNKIRYIAESFPKTKIYFCLDEPSINFIDQSFISAHQESYEYFLTKIKEYGIIGFHCCDKIDLSFFEKFTHYFLSFDTTINSVGDILEFCHHKTVTPHLGIKEADQSKVDLLKQLVKANSLRKAYITPSCGLLTHSIKGSEELLQFLRLQS
jgi:hypothetical protein